MWSRINDSAPEGQRSGDVIIAPSVPDDEAGKRFPWGRKQTHPCIRLVAQPSAN